MTITFLDTKTIGEIPELDALKELGNVTFYPVTAPSQTAERIRDAEVVITNKVVLDGTLMKAAPKLKLICVAATGMNNVDLKAAERLGIAVKNVSGYAADSVAQCTFAMLLHLVQNIPWYDQYVKSGEYSGSDIFTNVERDFWEISGKRFGIIGLGTIGRRVAEIAAVFGAEVVYHSTSGSNLDQPYLHLNLEDLLRTSDVVSIHAPLNEQTRNLLGTKELRLMKPSAILINTGRGGIVDEKALAEALDEAVIAGAALDVFEKEPIPGDNPLLKVRSKERLVMTPHMAWASVEARTALIRGVRENIEDLQAS